VRIAWRVLGSQRPYQAAMLHDEGPAFLAVGWRDDAEYRVSIEPTPRVDVRLGETNEREALLGFMHSVLPLALPLFGIEPLHGAAVAKGDAALLVLGPAGAGKSTISAALNRHGFAFMSDDACAIDDSGQVLPGPPLAAHHSPPEGWQVLAPYEEKLLASPRNARAIGAWPAAVVSLNPASGVEISRRALEPSEAFPEILGNVRAPWALPAHRVERQLRAVSRLSALPVIRVSWDLKKHPATEVAALIAAWASGNPVWRETP
jgi:hypothetical protein